jgi:hypothetical protein
MNPGQSPAARQNDPATIGVNSLLENARARPGSVAAITLEDWDDLRAEAARVHNRRTASYLLGIPLLPDYLEEALAAFGRSCEEFEEDHL